MTRGAGRTSSRRTSGDAARRLLGALVLTVLAGSALAACGDPAEGQAFDVENRLSRIDGVDTSDVRAVDPGATPRIDIEVAGSPTTSELLRLVAEVADTAATQEYAGYRLHLAVGTDAVVVDVDFAEREDAAALLERWQRAVRALDGRVSLVVGLDTRFEVDSGADLVRDVEEAAKLDPDPDTTWELTGPEGRLTSRARVREDDADAVRLLAAELSSSGQPVGARSWWLDRAGSLVWLDLVADLPSALEPTRLTRQRWQEPLRPVTTAAVRALRSVRGQLEVRLVHRTDSADDVFAWAGTARGPVPRRDPLERGWDRWLDAIAERLLRP